MLTFSEVWNKLETLFRKQAEEDGGVYLPNLTPSGPVDHVLIAMEPSLGRWTKGDNPASRRQSAQRAIEAGFRNFMYSLEDFLLHYAVQEYLCAPGQTYHVTDLSKAAMLVRDAEEQRAIRYGRWFHLLQKELEAVANPNASRWAIGRTPWEYLRNQSPPIEQYVIHYSSQAARWHSAAIRGREDEFERYRRTISLSDVQKIANSVLDQHAIPESLKAETLQRLSRAKIKMTDSRLALLFHYKTKFQRPNVM